MKSHSHASLYPTTLLTLLLLLLPGSAWAQVALSGQVRFTDGTAISNATVSASPTSGGYSQNTTSSTTGAYVLNLIPGTYNISVQYSVPGFYGSQQLVTAYTVSSSGTLNLTLDDIQLNGRIL
ncbi:MAG TPA: carboxypeptidase-like regulatory domain-containing protein, partial [Archangium sp.]|nr:carboxypeptidase-like regulatory domain-containing protein [Archangium sp.]